MCRITKVLFLAAALAGVSAASTVQAQAGDALRASARDPAPVETARFVFHDDARINLYHFLVNWATEDAGERPPWATPLQEHAVGLAALSADERTAWGSAVEAYARTVGRSFVRDDGLDAVRNAIAGIGEASAVPKADRPLLDALAIALPVYRRHWWASHREQNDAWIASVAPTLRQVEDGIARRLEVAYGGSWPEGRIRVDVVAYANALDAYSSSNVVTIGTGEPRNGMPQAIEIVFHEASHVEPLEGPLREGVARAFAAEGLQAPRRFWHDLIFFTSGDVTRLELERIGQPGYEHYGAPGVYRRAERWPPQLEVLEAHWRPYLESGDESEAARVAALRSVAAALGHDP